MTKPKILVTRLMPPNVEKRIARDYDAITNPGDDKMTAEQIIEASDGKDGVLCCGGDPMNADTMSRLPDSVKIVSTYSVGFEHVDVEAARSRGIVCTNTPDVLNDATADVAMLCLLGAARRASEADRFLRSGQWKVWHSTLLLGVHLGGKRLGIYGMGRIGRCVAQRARAFGMSIHYHNRSRLSPDLELDATYHETPESLLGVSDFLSINAPSSSSTVKFLNAERIALMPDGAVVANTARGELVDDDALIAALKSGKVSFAGLDVFAGEPKLDPRYCELENTLLLPHIGSASDSTRDDMGFCCLNNMDAFFAGKPTLNPL